MHCLPNPRTRFKVPLSGVAEPPHCVVIFKSKDADNLEQAFREFTAKTLSKEQRPSIRKVLAAAKQKAAQQPKRAKEKIKQRGLER